MSETWTVAVSGLSCHRCAETVRERLATVAGVDSVHVSEALGSTSHVTVHAESRIGDDVLQEALAEGGAFVIER